MLHVLITGGAGFIGSSLANQLIADGHQVTCVDNFDPFYNEKTKRLNLSGISNHPRFQLIDIDVSDFNLVKQSLRGSYDAIVHAAAKAGVHASIKHPRACYSINTIGTQNMLEFARLNNINQFIFASSSSIYGLNEAVPWKETDQNLFPISPYASSKLSSELLGYTYAHLYDIRFLSLRFFTVYGPRQRPDLAIHKFAKKIENQETINIYGDGTSSRDYTYIDDIIQGVQSALFYTESQYEVFNLGSQSSISLNRMIATIEQVFEKKAIINRLPMQAGDVPHTYADISKAKHLLNYQPKISFYEGIQYFKKWFKEHFFEEKII